MISTAAILARGLGSRMKRDDEAAGLDAAQRERADAGLKGMIPIERPFLDYVITALADAGITDVVLVIAPGPSVIRDYFVHEAPPSRVRMRFAVQQEPRGTADAVVSAAREIGDRPFLVLNADNYYPTSAIRALAAFDTAGVVAFDRDALVVDGAIDAERIKQFAVLSVAPDNTLRDLIEKPGESLDVSSDAARWVGMNLWAITPALVDSCARVPLSTRGEVELPQAVRLAISEGTVVRVVQSAEPVLDLSHRQDIANVTARLRGVLVHT